ncbi:MAG: glycosyltransferase family 4 protein [Nitrospirota bacterium]
MRLAFLGIKNSFDYFQIGGVESFVRRITKQLIHHNIEVDYIFYEANQEKAICPYQGLNLRYFKLFENALEVLDSSYDNVVEIYLLLKHRAKYASFRKNTAAKTSFHFIYFGWPDSLIKRKLYFSEARLFPYNGKLFCISKRQYEYVSKWSKNVVYILPPVPEDYFLEPNEKPRNDKLKVTFLGRIDPGKGINDVIEIFRELKNNDQFECSIYGIHIPEDTNSLEIHKWLKNQHDIRYIEVERKAYSPDVEEMVRSILKNTDILILPYQKLSSTIDTPLTLLEAMASLCCVITKPFGNIPDVYGKNEISANDNNFVRRTLNILNKLSQEDIIKERERIYEQNRRLNYRSDLITQKFIDSLDASRKSYN